MQEDYVQISGRKIYYVFAGQGPTTVLIHGWPTSSYIWRHIIPELSPKARIIAPDLPGFGRSEKLPAETIPTFTFYKQFIDEFIQALNLHQVRLIVHDIGGPPAILWALENQEKVSSIVMLNTVLHAQATFTDNVGQSFMRLPVLKNLLATRFSLKRILAAFTPYRPLTDDVIENYLEPFPAAQHRQALLHIINECLFHGRRDELQGMAAALVESGIRLAMLYGVRDPYCYYHMNRFYKEHPEPKSIFKKSFEDAGHFLPEEMPGPLAENILDFYDY